MVLLRRNEEGELETHKYVGDFDIELFKDFVKPFVLKKEKPKKVEEKSEEPPVVFKDVTVASLKEEIAKEEHMMLIHLYNDEHRFPILDEMTSRFK